MRYVRWFEELGLDDLPVVGGKTASLGELHRLLKDGPISVPDGFAITAEAYRRALTEAGAWGPLRETLAGLDTADVEDLSRRAAAARQIVYEATGGAKLGHEIVAAFQRLQAQVA